MHHVSRLGEILIGRGLLTTEQVEAILDEQAATCRPFGLLAEERFGLSREAVEAAWVEQYAMVAQEIDPANERIDEAVLGLITRRQAWQFQLLPIRFDGAELMTATTTDALPQAVRFATGCLTRPCYFVLAAPAALHGAIDLHYPMPLPGHPLIAS